MSIREIITWQSDVLADAIGIYFQSCPSKHLTSPQCHKLYNCRLVVAFPLFPPQRIGRSSGTGTISNTRFYGRKRIIRRSDPLLQQRIK
jgi:hypothetical protein